MKRTKKRMKRTKKRMKRTKKAMKRAKKNNNKFLIITILSCYPFGILIYIFDNYINLMYIIISIFSDKKCVKNN
jgi:diacylglycerol kinase